MIIARDILRTAVGFESALITHSSRHEGEGDPSHFNWSQISPSAEPRWSACYANLSCMRLLVPLDYDHPEGERAAIAIIKRSSSFLSGDERYKGPVVLNPGGPGNSGINFIVSHGERLAEIVGPEFDIVGFDPRGIGFTTPGLYPFATKAEAGAFYASQSMSVDASENTLTELLGRARILGQLVEARAKVIAENMSTAQVARDMLTMAEVLGDGKLSYWGMSYGTLLGQTFAVMFPSKIRRMLLDGVVDAEDYYSGAWTNSLQDTDRALLMLFEACFEAGPRQCPFHERNVSLITERYQRLLNQARRNPVPFFNATTEGYGLVDYSVVRNAVLQCLVHLYEKGSALVHALADLERGVAEPIFSLSGRAVRWKEYFSSDAASSPSFAGGMELGSAVACGDAEHQADNLESLRSYYADLANISSFAHEWTRRIYCAGWRVRAKERYTGPFVANTSFPMLFLGNTVDPVTPLRNAMKMAEGFHGSVVLTQKSVGLLPTLSTDLFLRFQIVPRTPSASTLEMEDCQKSGLSAMYKAPFSTIEYERPGLISKARVQDIATLDSEALISSPITHPHEGGTYPISRLKCTPTIKHFPAMPVIVPRSW